MFIHALWDIGLFPTYTNIIINFVPSVYLFKSIVFCDNSITTLYVPNYNQSR